MVRQEGARTEWGTGGKGGVFRTVVSGAPGVLAVLGLSWRVIAQVEQEDGVLSSSGLLCISSRQTER